MTPRLETVEEIFHAALDCEPHQLSAFLDQRCGRDGVLRSKIEGLLAAHRQAGNFIETPVANIASSNIAADHESDLLIGQTIGHYKILQRIGSGGMGDVYLASDITAGRKAALKLLPMGFTGNVERLTRFQREARAVVGLNHPNILTVYEIGEYDSSHYIASELIEGETLRQRLARGPVGVEEAIDVAVQIATALAAAHQARIVHCDIKPENIMLRPDRYVKVLDFGIANLTEQEVSVTMTDKEAVSLVETNLGAIVGTVRYMSPEQARGAPVDKRTDIWSLGVVLYEMVAGQAPFTGDTPREVMASILGTEPPPLTNSIAQTQAELQQIVSKALRKEREERYQSATELLEALKALRRKLEFTAELERSAAVPSWLRWTRSPTVLVLVLLVAGLALAFPFYWHRNLTPTSPPEKSIAVLPFQNLSKEPESAYFTAGVQDEILSSLAKIADLKVISRTSVMQYEAAAKRNLREIGQQLGVAHVLEGSVQRIENRVRIRAQLIDARTDAHIWAQTYDREAADLFAIQGEIANVIAAQLRAKISSAEHAAIEQPPTSDPGANDLYLRAIALEQGQPQTGPEALTQAVSLLEQAVARDPRFLRAYCTLAQMHLTFYYNGHDHTAARLKMADEAIQKAAQLQPDAGEVHLIKARYLSGFGIRDYDRAREELELARRTLPNDPAVYYEAALMDRRQGRWTEGLRNFERALESDPNNVALLEDAAATCIAMRRYADASQFCRRVVAIAPRNYWARINAALLPFYERADIRPLRKELNTILTEDPDAGPKIAFNLWYCAVLERAPAAADRALTMFPAQGFADRPELVQPRQWFVGYGARTFNRPEVATAAFAATRVILEKLVRDQPDNASAWTLLGRAQAALGQKEEAIKAGQRACELLPLSKEPTSGLLPLRDLANIYAWAGEKEQALQQLATYGGRIRGFHYGELRLDPDWDPLRGDPRFEEIVASLAPKEKGIE